MAEYEAYEDCADLKGTMRSNDQLLISNTVLVELAPMLVAERVLSYDENEQVTSAGTTNQSVSVLLSIMMQKSLFKCQQFRKALVDTGQAHIAGLLGEETSEIIMSKEHKNRLRSNHAKLYQRLDVRCLLNYLQSQYSVTSLEAQKIVGKHTDLEMRAAFLDLIIRKPDSAFYVLLDGLIETNQRHLACLLDPAVHLPETFLPNQPCMMRQTANRTQRRASSDSFLRQSKVYESLYHERGHEADCENFYEPLQTMKDADDQSLERCALLVQDKLQKGVPLKQLIVLLLGHTGAGKSSLINSLLTAIHWRGYQELAIRSSNAGSQNALHPTAVIKGYRIFQNLQQGDRELNFRCQPKIFDIAGPMEHIPVLQHPLMPVILRSLIQGNLKEGTNIFELLQKHSTIQDIIKKYNKVIAGMKIDRVVVVQACDKDINEELMSLIKEASDVPVSVILTKVDLVKENRIDTIMEKKQKLQECLCISDDDIMVTSLYCHKLCPGMKRRPDIDQDMCNLWLKWLHNGHVPVEEPTARNMEATQVIAKIKQSHFPANFNIALIGEAGSGKSSFINSVVMALNPSGYLDICPRGNPCNPTDNNRQNKTMFVTTINLLKHIQMVKPYGQLSLVECPGLPNETNSVTRTILKLFLNGQIPEDIAMDRLFVMKPEEMDKKFRKIKPARKINIVLIVYSASHRIPSVLFKYVQEVMMDHRQNGEELPIFAVMTNIEDLSDAELQQKTADFARAVGLEGQEEKIFTTSLYCNKMTPEMKRDPKIDTIMHAVMNKILAPEFVRIQKPPKKHSILRKTNSN